MASRHGRSSSASSFGYRRPIAFPSSSRLTVAVIPALSRDLILSGMARAFFLVWWVARHRFRVSAALARNDAVWMAISRHDAVLVVIARNGAVWGAKGCRPTHPVIPAHPSCHPGLEPGSMLGMARVFFLVWWVARHRFRVSAALARNDAVWVCSLGKDVV